MLFTVPLAYLSEKQLRRYAFKAITTWGNAADFRYFLPRLLELLLCPDSELEKDAFFDKMLYAGWDGWPEAEKGAVRQVLRAWWAQHIQHECFFEEELIGWLVRLTGSLEPLLQAWQPAETDWAFENLVRIIPHLPDLEKHIQVLTPDTAAHSMLTLRRWLSQQASVLEAGFFQQEPCNEEFTQAISQAHTLVTGLLADGTTH
ncbi:hypothetical protein [Hymenobacter metallilatus]|uniref:hypothetical protein n=1 Tax=Hymenobacter metallilatus TaxID=2493666 RepID=UPI000F677331|nr:hypothetical protein [Hymenobacter metallilatus]